MCCSFLILPLDGTKVSSHPSYNLVYLRCLDLLFLVHLCKHIHHCFPKSASPVAERSQLKSLSWAVCRSVAKVTCWEKLQITQTHWRIYKYQNMTRVTKDIFFLWNRRYMAYIRYKVPIFYSISKLLVVFWPSAMVLSPNYEQYSNQNVLFTYPD